MFIVHEFAYISSNKNVYKFSKNFKRLNFKILFASKIIEILDKKSVYYINYFYFKYCKQPGTFVFESKKILKAYFEKLDFK